MPSFFDPTLDKLDVLPAIPGFLFPRSTSSAAYNEFRTSTRNITRNIQYNPEIKLIGDDSLKRINNQSINFYIVNEGLGIPYVSPMLAESLGGLPPMLIVSMKSMKSMKNFLLKKFFFLIYIYFRLPEM